MIALAGCGRLGFDDVPVVPLTDANGHPACADPASMAACDDNDPCTVDDRCVQGVCGAGPATGCAAATRDIFRSAGTDIAALASGTGSLAISGTTAAFVTALPGRVGVGDVIEYDANGDGLRDSLAFIHGRLSATVYQVRDLAGATPTSTATATTSWAVFRAYGSLADVVDRNVGGTRNPSITASTFDGYAGGRDLVAANERLHVACYDDGLDSTAVQICDTSFTRSCATNESWTTDASHYLRIYTPVAATEVGTSQRHTGTPAGGYRRTNGLIMYQGYVRIDGLSLLRSTAGIGRSYYVETQGTGGEIWISNSFGWNSISGASKVYDIWDANMTPAGNTYTVFKLWNDIAYNETLDDPRSGFYINSDRAEAYIYACTSYVRGGGAFAQASLSRATLKNSVGVSTLNPAFITDNNFELVASSAANDASIASLVNGTNNAANVAVMFRDPAGIDFHLDPNEGALRGSGLDLSSDAALSFSTDIDGDPRPAGAWDIGADQVTP